MKKIILTIVLLFVAACSTDQQNTGGSSSISQNDLLGEWQYAGNHGEDPGKRIPGFLKEHGYIFSADGTWESRNKPFGDSHLTGTYTLDDGKLTMSSKSIIGGSGTSDVMLDNGNLILLSDITIRDGDKQPAQTRYKKIQ